MVIELCSEEDNPAKVYDVLEDTTDIIVTFEELLEDVDYDLKVSILVNGKIVSTVSKDLEKCNSIAESITDQDFTEESCDETKVSVDTTPLLRV